MLRRSTEALAVLVAVVTLGLLGWTWAVRMPYPYDLEWMEGGMLVHAWRLLNGEPLYVAPSPEFAPFVYPPAYPALLAALGSVGGLSPALGRGVSVLGTLLAAVSLSFAVYQPRRDGVMALVCAAVFLGTYGYTGAFFDLVRPDALMMGVLGASIALALRRRGWWASALLLALAFTVKHNAAFFGPALVLGITVRDGPRRGGQFAALASLPSLLFVGLAQWQSDGHFWTYLVDVPRSHPLVGDRLFPGALIELGCGFPLVLGAAAWWNAKRPGSATLALAAGALVTTLAQLTRGHVGLVSWTPLEILGVMALIVLLVRWTGALLTPSSDDVFAWALGITAVGMCLWMRAHSGGFVNVLIPFFWIAACFCGRQLTLERQRAPVMLAFGLTLIIQTWHADHVSLRPTPADREVADGWVETLERVDGPVLSPFAAWLPTYAGHDPGLHGIVIMDLDHPGGPFPDAKEALQATIDAGRWGAIVSGGRDLGLDLSRYRRRSKLLHPNNAGAPKTGWRVRPQAVWVPQP